jgi:hypothetical protein
MKKAILLSCLLLLIASTCLYAKDQKDEDYIPKNLDEAIQQLDLIFDDTTKVNIMKMSELEFTGKTHFTTGMWIRNKWGLWEGKELALFFNELGIYHPDDMSAIILTCYLRHQQGKPYELNKQVRFYQEYWVNLKQDR